MPTRYYLNPKQESKVRAIQDLLCLNSPADVISILIATYADDFIYKMSNFAQNTQSNQQINQTQLVNPNQVKEVRQVNQAQSNYDDVFTSRLIEASKDF